MSEKTREADRLLEQQAREEAEREKAADKARAEEAREEEEQEAQAEEVKRAKPRGPWLSRSPAGRLGLAFAFARIPLAEQLAPHVIECDWRPDGQLRLTLNRDLELDLGESQLRFDRFVTARVEHDGIAQVEGVQQIGEQGGQVERLAGADMGRVLVLQLVGAPEPVRAPTPPREKTATVL